MHLLRYSIQIVFVLTFVVTLATCAEEFRLYKFNLLWRKAQSSLGESKLKDFKHDLLSQEREQLQAKKLKSLGADKKGIYEATARKHLLRLMSKYGLDRYFEEIDGPIEINPDPRRDNIDRIQADLASHGDADHGIRIFRDDGLEKIWRKAEASNLKHGDLMCLYEDMSEYQKRLDNHNEIADTMQEEILVDGRFINSIDPLADTKLGSNKYKETVSEKKSRLNSNAQQALKKEYQDIKKGIDDLRRKVISGEYKSVGPFDETAVNELWSYAQESNMSPEQLDSFKEELEHYEVRIKKLKHFQNQLERLQIEVSDPKYDDPEAKLLKRKVKELKHKVDITHDSLYNKVLGVKDEL